jgi:hypothetical protein
MQRSQKLMSCKSSNYGMGIHVGDQRFLIEWIQRSTGVRDFPWTLTVHHASPLMDVLDPFGTSLFYYRARQDFGYRGFATREDKVSCPLVSRVPKCRSVDRQPRVPPMDGPGASMDHGVYGLDFFLSCKSKKGSWH